MVTLLSLCVIARENSYGGPLDIKKLMTYPKDDDKARNLSQEIIELFDHLWKHVLFLPVNVTTTQKI